MTRQSGSVCWPPTLLITVRFAILLPLCIVAIAWRVQAQDLNVYMAASSEVVGPGDHMTYVLTVTNTGAVDLLGVSVEIQLPDHITSFGTPPEFNCGSSGCNPGELITWDVGTVTPGSSRTTFYTLQIAAAAPEVIISSSAVASADNDADASTSLDVSIDPTPLLRLSLAAESAPAEPGEVFTYTLTFGNVGSASPSAASLMMPVPDGTSFDSASHGGTESGGVVTWNIGLLPAAGGGEVQASFLVDEESSDGDVLLAAAELDPATATEYVVRSSTVTPIRAGSPLHIEYGISQTAVGADEQLTFTLTASNTGPVDLLDVAARILLPGSINSFGTPPEFNCGSSGCNPNEIVSWSPGALAPGESRTTFFRTTFQNGATPGEVPRSILTAEASNALQIAAALNVQVDPTPLLRLSLAPESGPAVPGDDFTYTITIGNAGSASPTDVALRVWVPEGATYVSATGGASESDGVISWDLGLFGVGASSQVQFTVRPDAGLPDGSLLQARAELDAGLATEYVVRSTAVTPVRASSPLRVEYAVSQTALGADDQLTVSVTASNTGPVDLLNVTARILLPGSITSFGTPPELNCGSSGCNPDEAVTWSVGNLPPGESRTTFFRTFIASGAPPGEVLRSLLTATASNAGLVSATVDIQVDPTPLLTLSVAPDPAPAAPGEPFTYTITFGNVGASSPSDVLLTMTVPAGASFTSATSGGVESGGVVLWQIPLAEASKGGRVGMTITPEATLPNGSLLLARAELDPGSDTEVVVRASTVTPVRADSPLRVDYDVDATAAVSGGDLTYTISATNEGPVELLDVAARILLPGSITTFATPADFNCGSSNCNPNEAVTWSVGSLAAGQTMEATFSTTVASGAPMGGVLRSRLALSASNSSSNQALGRADVLLGELVELNQPPSAPAITTPEDGAMVHVGGSDEGSALPGDTPFVVEWLSSSDPEGGPVEYAWQVSRSEDFMELLIDVDAPRATLRYETDYTSLAEMLSSEGVSLGESLMLYHRIVATDFTHEVPSAAQTITFTRGRIVGIDSHLGVPTEFVLHSNYPNPFNPATTFRFDLPEPADVQLIVYDMTGRKVATVVSAVLPAGSFDLVWDARALSSGTYMYRLTAGAHSATRTLVVLQ